MNLETIENQLRYYRREKKFPALTNIALIANLRMRIESNNNYTILKFISYIQSLGFDFAVNEKVVKDPIELGQELTTLRKKAGLTQLSIQMETGLTQARIVSIEKGRGYKKRTLLLYLAALEKQINIEFNLIDKYGITKENS